MMNSEQALAYLRKHNIPVKADFFQLDDADIANVIAAAVEAKYKRPKGGQGSKAKNFYRELMRHFKRD